MGLGRKTGAIAVFFSKAKKKFLMLQTAFEIFSERLLKFSRSDFYLYSWIREEEDVASSSNLIFPKRKKKERKLYKTDVGP